MEGQKGPSRGELKVTQGSSSKKELSELGSVKASLRGENVTPAM
jgi:hypothetical protein